MEHGARLGWLIDPFGGVAYIYRPDQSPSSSAGPICSLAKMYCRDSSLT